MCRTSIGRTLRGRPFKSVAFDPLVERFCLGVFEVLLPLVSLICERVSPEPAKGRVEETRLSLEYWVT